MNPKVHLYKEIIKHKDLFKLLSDGRYNKDVLKKFNKELTQLVIECIRLKYPDLAKKADLQKNKKKYLIGGGLPLLALAPIAIELASTLYDIFKKK